MFFTKYKAICENQHHVMFIITVSKSCPILAPLSNPNSSKCLLIGVPLMAIVEVLQQVQMQTYKARQQGSRPTYVV